MIGFAGGLNLYGYVGGNPTNAVDPSGLWKDIASVLDQLRKLDFKLAGRIQRAIDGGYRIEGGARPVDCGGTILAKTWPVNPAVKGNRRKKPAISYVGGTWLKPELSDLDAAIMLGHEFQHYNRISMKTQTDPQWLKHKGEYQEEKQAYLEQFRLTKAALDLKLEVGPEVKELYDNWKKDPNSLKRHIVNTYGIVDTEH